MIQLARGGAAVGPRDAKRAAIPILCLVGLLGSWLVGVAVGRADQPLMELPGEDSGQILDVRGMTFVASEGTRNEIVVRAETARFYPEHEIADLQGVEVEVEPGDDRVGFSMACDGGRLNLATQSFVADGHVVGTIEGGRRFEASWVAYDEAEGVLYTDDPVLIVDEGGRYRGGGFRYLVDEGRFKLLGGATVVQDR
jgi:hypothetical protein